MKNLSQPSPRRPRPSKYRASTFACLVGAGAVFLAGCTCRIECGPDIPAAIRIIEVLAEK